jgi:hypothetical protein
VIEAYLRHLRVPTDRSARKRGATYGLSREERVAQRFLEHAERAAARTHAAVA